MTLSFYRIVATLTAKSPLHLGSGRRTGVIKHSYPYIPGSMLRGALGMVILRSVCRLDEPLVDHEKCEFFEDCLYARLFGEEFGKSSRLFFRYAYPLHLRCGGVYRPAAKTVYVCKNPQCRKIYDVMVPPIACENCESSVSPFRGFRCDGCGDLIRYPRYPISMSRITLTALDRSRGSAAQVIGAGETKGTLHTIEVVARGSKFAFELLVHRGCGDDLDVIKKSLVRGLPDEGVGGGKSRGLGKVSVDDLRVEKVSVEDVEKRAEEIDTRSFSVRTLSPLLLGSNLLEPKTLLEGARRAYTWIFHVGKPKLPDIHLKGRRLSIETFGGWSLKTQRQRRIEPAISTGSVFQFESGVRDEVLAKALAALEHYPLGAYKPHGCGQLRIEGPR